jgi:hypothetical protein
VSGWHPLPVRGTITTLSLRDTALRVTRCSAPTGTVWLVGLVLALAPAAARAQVAVAARIGVLLTTDLVHDSIVEPISVQVRPAPLVGLSLEASLGAPYVVGAGLALSHSNVVAHSASGDVLLTSLTVWHPTLAVGRPITPWLGVEARIGAVIYAPGNRTANLFQGGAPVDATLGAAVQLERRLGAGLSVGIALQYDATRFTTNTLKAQGFAGATVVHRVALAATIRRVVKQQRKTGAPAR